MLWTLMQTEQYARRFKRYHKNRPREVMATLDNLDTFVTTLNAGATIQDAVRFGFVHRERRGVWAIDQSGHEKNLSQMRLYVYPQVGTATVYQITLGDKVTQQEDIKTCDIFIAWLKSGAGG